MTLNNIHPTVLVLLSVFSVQIGAGLATQLFPLLGAEGTVAIRIIIAAILLIVLARVKLRTLKPVFSSNIALLIGFGLCIAAMNLFFYLSISLIPLGAAVAIEFIGPLGIAALKSKRKIHLLWVSLAALGIILLSPLAGVQLDTTGIIYAFLAGAAWAVFILLAEQVGRHIPGNDGLVIGMAVAAIVMIPFAIPVASALFSEVWVLLAALGVALLSTTIPFSLEFEALKRMPARSYGILVSIEPAVAALIGAILLGERIGLQGMFAVSCVVAAAIGISISDRQETNQPII